jgi:hypothetical protein
VPAPVRTTVLRPGLQRSLGARLTSTPRAYGWCRTRWRGATLAMELKVKHGLEVSAWTGRRWRHERDGVGQRATLVAKDAAPQRVERLARRRWPAEPWQAPAVRVCAAALDSHLWPKSGAAWRPKGPQLEVRTPGQHATHSLAGALHLATGEIRHGRSARNTTALCRALLTRRDHASPAPRMTRIDVVVDHDGMHQAQAVGQWIERPPRLVRLWLPTYGPQANPLERACGDGHDQCPRTQQRKRLRDVVSDVERHLRQNGPWLDTLSQLYDAPEVTAAVERIAAAERINVAA